MRNAAAGFLLGYLMFTLLMLPGLLSAMQVTPGYVSGVTLVLERSGMVGAVRSTLHDAAEFRDARFTQLSHYLARKMTLGSPD